MNVYLYRKHSLHTCSKYSLVEPDPLLDATQKSSDSKLTISSELLVTEFNIIVWSMENKQGFIEGGGKPGIPPPLQKKLHIIIKNYIRRSLHMDISLNSTSGCNVTVF